MQTHPHITKWYKFCPQCKTELNPREENITACPSCDFIFYNNPATATITLLINDNQEVLLGIRKVDPQKGYWDNPGGFVSVAESGENAAIREMKEETGLDVEIVDYLGSIDDIYGITPTLNLVYVVKTIGGTLQPADDVSELKWFTMKDIPWDKMAFANTKIAVEMYQDYLTKEL